MDSPGLQLIVGDVLQPSAKERKSDRSGGEFARELRETEAREPAESSRSAGVDSRATSASAATDQRERQDGDVTESRGASPAPPERDDASNDFSSTLDEASSADSASDNRGAASEADGADAASGDEASAENAGPAADAAPENAARSTDDDDAAVLNTEEQTVAASGAAAGAGPGAGETPLLITAPDIVSTSDGEETEADSSRPTPTIADADSVSSDTADADAAADAASADVDAGDLGVTADILLTTATSSANDGEILSEANRTPADGRAQAGLEDGAATATEGAPIADVTGELASADGADELSPERDAAVTATVTGANADIVDGSTPDGESEDVVAETQDAAASNRTEANAATGANGGAAAGQAAGAGQAAAAISQSAVTVGSSSQGTQPNAAAPIEPASASGQPVGAAGDGAARGAAADLGGRTTQGQNSFGSQNGQNGGQSFGAGQDGQRTAAQGTQGGPAGGVPLAGGALAGSTPPIPAPIDPGANFNVATVAAPGQGVAVTAAAASAGGAAPASLSVGAQGAGSGTPIAAQLASHIADGVRMQRHVLHVRLDPPELARVKVELKVTGGTVEARMVVERADTLEAFRQDGGGLMRQLASAGFEIEESGLEFVLEEDGQTSGGSQESDERNGAGSDGAQSAPETADAGPYAGVMTYVADPELGDFDYSV